MKPVALIGPPGSGKTAVGQMLAARLGVAFLDLDELVAARLGELGELYITQDDSQLAQRIRGLLAEVLAGELVGGGVVAVSSGIVANVAGTEETAPGGELATAFAGAFTVYLKSDLAHTFSRSGMNGPLPLGLFGTRALWREHLERRDPHYGALADLVVEVGELDVAEVTDQVAAALPA